MHTHKRLQCEVSPGRSRHRDRAAGYVYLQPRVGCPSRLSRVDWAFLHMANCFIEVIAVCNDDEERPARHELLGLGFTALASLGNKAPLFLRFRP